MKSRIPVKLFKVLFFLFCFVFDQNTIFSAAPEAWVVSVPDVKKAEPYEVTLIEPLTQDTWPAVAPVEKLIAGVAGLSIHDHKNSGMVVAPSASGLEVKQSEQNVLQASVDDHIKLQLLLTLFLALQVHFQNPHECWYGNESYWQHKNRFNGHDSFLYRIIANLNIFYSTAQGALSSWERNIAAYNIFGTLDAMMDVPFETDKAEPIHYPKEVTNCYREFFVNALAAKEERIKRKQWNLVDEEVAGDCVFDDDDDSVFQTTSSTNPEYEALCLLADGFRAADVSEQKLAELDKTKFDNVMQHGGFAQLMVELNLKMLFSLLKTFKHYPQMMDEKKFEKECEFYHEYLPITHLKERVKKLKKEQDEELGFISGHEQEIVDLKREYESSLDGLPSYIKAELPPEMQKLSAFDAQGMGIFQTMNDYFHDPDDLKMANWLHQKREQSKTRYWQIEGEGPVKGELKIAEEKVAEAQEALQKKWPDWAELKAKIQSRTFKIALKVRQVKAIIKHQNNTCFTAEVFVKAMDYLCTTAHFYKTPKLWYEALLQSPLIIQRAPRALMPSGLGAPAKRSRLSPGARAHFQKRGLDLL